MNDFNLTPDQANKLASHLEHQASNDFNIDLGSPKVVSDEPVQAAPKPLIIPETRPEIKKDDIKKRISDLEKEYYGGVGIVSPSASATSYKDEYGNDTYYVKNISGGHVTIKDPDITIPKGTIMDLLQYASIEDIYSCRDMRVAMSPSNRMGSMLKRLTQREYLEEMEREVLIKKKIDIVKQQDSLKQIQNPNNNMNQYQNNKPPMSQGPKVRPMVMGKVEKLRLSYDPDPDNSKFGIAPVEFIQWVMGEALSEEELDYLLGDPVISNKHDIKAAIVEKKTIM